MQFNKHGYALLNGDCLQVLKTLDGNMVDCCVTSPPYFNLRDYGTAVWTGGSAECQHVQGQGGICSKCGAHKQDLQVGMEDTPQEYIDKLVEVFRQVRRVLKDDGTLWVNIGDCYCNSNGYMRSSAEYKRRSRDNAKANDRGLSKLVGNGYKVKDKIGIPWMLAFALRQDGWYLRQDIIWAKQNPMPESVKDRCTGSHEYIFLLSKSPNYYFDYEAIQQQANYDGRKEMFSGSQKYEQEMICPNGKRNKRDVWTVPTKGYNGAHFAIYPKKLIEPCILAGSRKDGIVLDPFNGAGTTGLVALKHGRRYIGIELKPEYIEITEERYRHDEDFTQQTLF